METKTPQKHHTIPSDVLPSDSEDLLLKELTQLDWYKPSACVERRELRGWILDGKILLSQTTILPPHLAWKALAQYVQD